MPKLSIFQCIDCGNEYDIHEIRYRCNCGELLEVIHDLHTSIPDPEKWKCSLDNHLNQTSFHRYKDILFPSSPKDSIISLQEGDTPLYDVSGSFTDF